MQELLGSFVAVADEVGRLQRDRDPECELFRGFCEQGHYGGRTMPTSTRQGIYAVAPSGAFLASINSTDATKVADMLRAALERWRHLPDAQRFLPAERLQQIEATKRFEDRYPEDGLVLAMYVRDLHRAVDAKDWRTAAWNEDQAWFTKNEAAAMVPAEPAVGARVDVPRRLVERLARLHLVDTVRGQAPPFRREDVLAAELRAEVVRIDGDRVHLSLAGTTHTRQRGRWPTANRGSPTNAERGVRTELEGRAVWDRSRARFATFELIATGTRWGATQYNERGKDLEPTAIGFAFVLAPPDHPRVAPAFWWDYDLR